MKKNKTLVIVLLAFVLLLGGAYVLYNRLSREVEHDQLAVQGESRPPESAAGAEDGADSGRTRAPDFTVYDREGGEVHLSDFIGKPVVLNFWASWCGPCQSEMPDFNEAYAELGEEIHFLMVNMTTSSRESFEKATALIDAQGYSFPVFYDLDSDAAAAYGVNSLPTTLFIDAEGYGIAQAVGAIDRETLQKGVDMILKQ